jgi:hypothetical protein
VPTYYDILPELQKKIVDLLADFLREDEGQFHRWEITVLVPASNSFLHYLRGVNDALRQDNYISATANLRGLIETLGAIVYDGVAKLPQEGYDRLIKKGRLPKWDEKTKKWGDLGPRESVKYAQLVIDENVKLLDVYDDCCDLLHFSSKHLTFLGGFSPDVKDTKGLVNFKIGHKDNIPPKIQKDMINLCAELATGLGKCIVMGTTEKENRKKRRQSKI